MGGGGGGGRFLEKPNFHFQFVNKLVVEQTMKHSRSSVNLFLLFYKIYKLVLPNGKMCDLINYICQPWIEHPVFLCYCWTAYNIIVRFSHNRFLQAIFKIYFSIETLNYANILSRID